MVEKFYVGKNERAIAIGFSAGIMLLISFFELIPEAIDKTNIAITITACLLGILVALAIAIHNIPEEFAMAVPIVAVKTKRFLYMAAFLSGLAEPLGAIIGLVTVHFHPIFNPLFMAFAAGAMIFVSVHELLPMARRYRKIHLFILGIIISVFVYALLSAVIPE